MNDHQDNAAQTGEDTPVEAPKKRRAPRKTAAVVTTPAEVVVPEPVAPVADETAVAAPKKRRTTRKAAEATAPVEAVPAEVTPAAEAAPAPAVEPASAPAPARAPRSRKKVVTEVAAPVAEPVQLSLVESPEAPPAMAQAPVEPVVAVPSAAAAAPEAAPAAEAVAVAAAVPAEAAAAATAVVAEGGEPAAEGEGTEGGRRRGRDRDRKGRRERRGRDEVAPAPAPAGEAQAGAASLDDDDEDVVEIVVGFDDDDAVDTGSLFAEVVSGEYDAGVEPAPEEEAEAGKRVLRPEPEAPKLHKVLAQAGIGSRREMEQLIEDGQVSVNGEPAHIGMRIAQGDQIRLAGRPIKVRIAPPPARVLAYHKVVGEVVTHHDPEGRPTVFRRLPRLHTGKWLSVGRLDINTEGLLLFTNSGDLANQLMHPRFGVEREYAVRVLGSLSTEQRARLLDGVEVEGQKAAFKSIEDGGGEGVNHWYRVVITEGRNREVRKLFDTVGLAVSRLIRIRYGTVVLPRGLKRGVWVELDDQDVRNIRQLAGNDQGPRPVQGQQGQGRGQGQGEGPRDSQRGQGKKSGRGQGQSQGQGQGQQGQGRDRDNQPSRSKGAQHGGDRGVDRQDRQERQDRQGGRGGQPGGPQGNPGQGQRPPRGPRPDGQYPQGAQGGGGRGPRGGNGGNGGNGGGQQGGGQQGSGEDPLYIPNPLEQTFDKRFVSGSKRITTGFGRPTEEPVEGGNNRKGGPRQPDPMQTSVGYIGAEAYFTRPGGGNNKGRGGRRR